MSDDLAVKLRSPLRALGFAHQDGTRDLGMGTAFPTTGQIPGGLRSGDRYFRSDLAWACVYDGTRWRTQHEYSYAFEIVNYGTTSPQATAVRVIRADYAPSFTHIAAHSRVSTTNNGTNYWDVAVQSFDSAFATSDTVYSFNTQSDGTGYVRREAGPAIAHPTNRYGIRVYVVKTGAPGALEVGIDVAYRLVIT